MNIWKTTCRLRAGLFANDLLLGNRFTSDQISLSTTRTTSYYFSHHFAKYTIQDLSLCQSICQSEWLTFMPISINTPKVHCNLYRSRPLHYELPSVASLIEYIKDAEANVKTDVSVVHPENYTYGSFFGVFCSGLVPVVQPYPSYLLYWRWRSSTIAPASMK